MKKGKFLIFTILAIIIPIIFGNIVPISIVEISFSLSVAIKTLLIFTLPFIIFCFVFSALIRLDAKEALSFVLVLLVCVFISNLLAIFTGYFVANIILPSINLTKLAISSNDTTLYPLWDFNIKPLIKNEHALICGFILGMICSFYKNNKIAIIGAKLNLFATSLLRYFFVPIIPIFVLGSMFKLNNDGLLHTALSMYGSVWCVIVTTQIIYLSALGMIAANFNISLFWEYLKNILPATLTGFSTASSAAALPILTIASGNNLKNEDIAKIVVPSAINIHTIGSAISITILCMATIMAFGRNIPTLEEFYFFGLLYAISKFAVAGVPGGVMLVIAPLIEAHLHFSNDMLALVTGIYVIFDPFGTAANVTGNGIFAVLFTKIARKLGIKMGAKTQSH